MKFFLVLAACVLAVSAVKDEHQCSAPVVNSNFISILVFSYKYVVIIMFVLMKRADRRIPKLVTTTTVYLDEEDDLSSRRSHGCSNNTLHALLNEMVSSRDAAWVKSTWEIIKKDGDFAPKVYLR